MVDWNNIKHGESLSKAQFDEIMSEIVRHHRFSGSTKKNANGVNRYIKYIRPNWDMRDLKCFFIQFDYKEFDSRDSDDSMYDRIMKWLNEEGEDEVATEPIPPEARIVKEGFSKIKTQ